MILYILKSAVDPSHGSCEILGIIIQLRAHSVSMDGSSVAASPICLMIPISLCQVQPIQWSGSSVAEIKTLRGRDIKVR